jgi:hypothetical protein
MATALFVSENMIKQSTAINMNVSTDLILPYILQSQKLYLEPKLGTDLYNEINDEIVAASVSTNNEILLEEYIAPMLVNWSFFHLLPFLRFRVENGNIYSKDSENGTPLSTEEAQHLREEIRNTSEYYTERMISYLNNNTSLYPKLSTNTGNDLSPDSNAYYCGINSERQQIQGGRLTLQDFITTGFDC